MGDGSNTIDATRRREGYTGDPDGPAAGAPTATSGRNAYEDAPLKMLRWITGDTCEKDGPLHDFDVCANEPARTVSGPGHEAELFVKEGGDGEDVEPSDVMQNKLGDCYLMATLAGLAATPEGRALIHDALRENKDPTGNVVSYSVKLYDTEHHLLEAATVVAKWIEVPASEPYVQGHAIARSDGVHEELWPLLIEKAYARLRGGYNGMAKGGEPADAIKALTGKPASVTEPGDVTAQQIRAALDAHQIILLTTRSDLPTLTGACTDQPASNKSCIVHDHVYTVQSLEDSGGGEVLLHLRNPWGDPGSQPPPFPLADLAKSFSAVGVGSP